MKLLVHGDSNTFANYTGDGGNWPEVVRAGLGYDTLVNMAVVGYYSQGVLNNLSAMLNEGASLTLIMIGTNDVAGGLANSLVHDGVLALYLSNLGAVMDAFLAAHLSLVVMTPPFSLDGRSTARLAETVLKLRALCAQKGVPCIDVWGTMAALSAVKAATIFRSYFYPKIAVPVSDQDMDPYHLSHVGHDLVADTVLRVLTAVPRPITVDAQPELLFDHSAVGGYQVSTFDYECHGDLLLVGTAQTSGSISSVVFSGVPLSPIGPGYLDGYGYLIRLWGLVNPQAGNHSLCVNGAAGNFCTVVHSYKQYRRATLPTLYHGTEGGAGDSRVESLSITQPGTWLMMLTRNTAGSAAAGQGATRRCVSSLLFESFDSNGPVPLGSQSMTVLSTGASAWASQIVAIAPGV